jgi:hypothetical protein
MTNIIVHESEIAADEQEFTAEILGIPGLECPEDATPQERLAFARVVSTFIGDGVPMSECYNKTCVVTGAVIYPIDLVDRTSGEVIRRERTVWLCQDGTVVAAVSPVAARWTRQVLQAIFGESKNGMLSQAVEVIVRSRQATKGKTFSFELV